MTPFVWLMGVSFPDSGVAAGSLPSVLKSGLDGPLVEDREHSRSSTGPWQDLREGTSGGAFDQAARQDASGHRSSGEASPTSQALLGVQRLAH